MFNIFSVNKNAVSMSYLFLQATYKTKPHWAKLRKKTGPKYKALNHFDDFYGSVFGDSWPPVKEALLRRSKYVAVVNNYGDVEETIKFLSYQGAHCLRNLMKIQQDFENEHMPNSIKIETESHSQINVLDNYISKVQSDEVLQVYPNNDNVPDKIDLSHDSVVSTKEMKIEQIVTINKTLDQALDEAEIDQSRLIDPSMGINSESLYQYVPATKLKGMDDWVSESEYYSHYISKDGDFPLLIEPETDYKFPEHLKVYSYEMGSDFTMFSEPKRTLTGVFNYYPMDCGSVLAVLALCLSPGDRVLDLCSAPGGKSLVALQTLLPDIVVCNDVSISRTNRMKRIFRDYLIDYETNNKWRERVLITHEDGREFTDDRCYDKVLVDVPCTIDRHSVMDDENNIFRADRVKERLRIPELQTQLLVNALKLVRVGGAVVYSTCSLSPIQNDGVVHAALRHAFQSHKIVAVVRDLSSSISGLSSTLQLGNGALKPRYGQLVAPSLAANFGPTYIARLVRVK